MYKKYVSSIYIPTPLIYTLKGALYSFWASSSNSFVTDLNFFCAYGVCMCTGVCICSSSCVYLYAYVFGGQRSTSGSLFYSSPSYFLRPGLSLNLGLADLASLAGQWTPGIFLRITGIHHSTSFLCSFWESALESLCFHSKHFTEGAINLPCH